MIKLPGSLQVGLPGANFSQEYQVWSCIALAGYVRQLANLDRRTGITQDCVGVYVEQLSAKICVPCSNSANFSLAFCNFSNGACLVSFSLYA